MKTGFSRFLTSVVLSLGLTTVAFADVLGSTSLRTKDGRMITGRIRAESEDDITLEGPNGFVTISKAELAADSANAPTVSSSDELATLRDRVAQQEKIIAALQAENQALRATLANQPSGPGSASLTPAASVTRSSPVSVPAAAAVQHWMSSTGKRHNANCRYFGSGNGHPCGAQDGVACKICGG